VVNEADIVGQIDFGEAESILSNTSNSPLSQLLLDLTNELIVDLRKELVKSRASGNLEQSIVPSKINPESIEVTAPYYWKYINYGVNGTIINRGAPTHGQAPKTGLSFHDAIKKWIYDKGIPIPQGSTHDGLAYAIQKRLVTNGIEATHFYDKVVTPQRVEEMSKPISALLRESIITIIKKPTT
jgi:hypothetical protein